MKISRFKWLSAIVILGIGAVAMTSLGSTEKETNKRKPVAKIRRVETQTIRFASYEIHIDGNGVVYSQADIEIISEITGKLDYTLNQLKTGTLVKKGDVLARINSEEAQNSVRSLRAEFMTTVSSILPSIKIEKTDLFDKWNKYFENLSLYNSIPELPPITTAREKLLISNNRIYTNYFAVKTAEIRLARHTIRSPLSGVIKSAGKMTGEYVSAGQKLAAVIDYMNVEVSVPLLVEDAGWIDLKTDNEVKIYPDISKEFWVSGQISNIDRTLDPNSQLVNININFTNEKDIESLLPGNYVDVRISGKQLNNVAVIPRSSIVDDEYIFVIENDRLAKYPVHIIFIQQDDVVIANTIAEGIKLITTILQKPLIGMNVTDSAGDEEVTLMEQ